MAANVQNPNFSHPEKATNDQSVAESDDQSDIPIVFQCKQCRSIVGDSLAWVCVDRNLRSITLRSVVDVNKSSVMNTSCDEYDMGSTYYQLKCNSCNKQLGRMYMTTPKHLDHLRGLYTLLAETITSYQLGSTKPQNQESDLLDTYPTLESLRQELHKTQIVVLTLNGRFNSLVTSLEKGTPLETNKDSGLDLQSMLPEGHNETSFGRKSNSMELSLNQSNGAARRRRRSPRGLHNNDEVRLMEN